MMNRTPKTFRRPPMVSCTYYVITDRGAQWAKSGGEAVLLQFSDFTKDIMHDLNRLFC